MKTVKYVIQYKDMFGGWFNIPWQERCSTFAGARAALKEARRQKFSHVRILKKTEEVVR